MKAKSIALLAVAAVAVTLSLTNASWLAPMPEGRLTLVAHRGIAQPVEEPEAPGCSARRVREFTHNYIENTLFSLQGAVAHGARGFLLDVRTSHDGHAVIFRDETLNCRTDGVGRVQDRVLAYLKTLDMGFGYTADGRTYPLRGRGVGAMLTAAEAIRAYPREPLVFELSRPEDAASIVRAFRQAGVEIDDHHGFAGPPDALRRLRELTPKGWVLDGAASRACLSDYRRSGWLGLVPDGCRDAALLLPRGGGWTLWGWPYRFLDRMADAGARFLIARDTESERLVGLDRPEQLGEVPRHYRGLLLVEDMWNVGRALD